MDGMSRLDRAMGILAVCDQTGQDSIRCETIGSQYLDGFQLTGASEEVRQAVESYGVQYNEIMKCQGESEDLAGMVYSPRTAAELLTNWRHLAEIVRDSESERILSRLRNHGGELPIAEITEASRHRDWFASLISAEFEKTVDTCVQKSEEIVKSSKNRFEESILHIDSLEGNSLPFFSFFLFLEWEVAASVPSMLRVLESPEYVVYTMFGDALYEVLPRYLAHFLSAEIDRIDEIIRNTKPTPMVRWTAANSYEYLIRDGRISLDEAVDRLDRLFQETKVAGEDGLPSEDHEYELSAGIALVLQRIGGAAKSNLSRNDLDWEFVEQFMIDRDSFVDSSPNDRRKLKSTVIVDTLEELRSWACFAPKTERPPQPIAKRPVVKRPVARRVDEAMPEIPALRSPSGTIRGNERTPRNSKCPCGSGKKYKNCCLHSSKSVDTLF